MSIIELNAREDEWFVAIEVYKEKNENKWSGKKNLKINGDPIHHQYTNACKLKSSF
jgi:hypothetical protein